MAFALAVVYLGMVLLVYGVFGFAFGVGAS
jgi:hypothetical protein